MNLKEVMDSAELIPNVKLALDLGAHRFCDFSSNCPKAIQLRMLIQEAGIDMGQILQGYAQITSQPDPDKPIDPAQFFPAITQAIDGHVNISIEGVNIPIDLTDTLRREVQNILSSRIRRISESERSVIEIARELYYAYKLALTEARANKAVEQVNFPVPELLSSGIISNKSAEGGYNFYFPVTYQPQYLISNGVRSVLSQEDKNTTRRDDLLIRIEVSSSDTFISITLIEKNNRLFQHYHGGGFDCWGNMRTPDKWDKTLKQLTEIVHDRMGALGTINLDSLLNHDPPGMPTTEQLRRRATLLGREGEVREPEPNTPPITFHADTDGNIVAIPAFEVINDIAQERPTEPRRWGRGR